MVGNVGGDNLDVLTYGLLNKKVEEAKNVSGEKITAAVNTYLDENPPVTGATAEQAAQIDKNVADIDELKSSYDEAVTNSHVHSNKSVIDAITDEKVASWDNKVNDSDLAVVAKTGSYNDLNDIPDSLPASDVYQWAKQSQKPTYTADEVGALPKDTEIPSKTSDLRNDSGFLKQPANAQVGQIFRVQSITEDGSLVLEAVDMPSGGSGGAVNDVQIDGTSIVGENGVAEIPILNGMSAGLCRTDADKGVLSSNGQLYLSEASNSQIDERNKNKAILPSNIDYAVKCAMCDGKGEAWTAEEQKMAKERMGIPSGVLGQIDDISISPEKTWSSQKISDELEECVKLVKIAINLIGSEGNVPLGNTVYVYEIVNEIETLSYSVLCPDGTITVRVPHGIQYRITASTDAEGFYAPTEVTGVAINDSEVTIRYTELAYPKTIRDLQTLAKMGLAADVVAIGDEFTTSYTYDGNEYEMPWIVTDIKDVEFEDGSTGQGVYLEAKHCTIESIQFDAPHQEVATEETAIEGLYYIGRTDNTYTLLTLNTGDTIPYSDYTYVYHDTIRDTYLNIYKYGHNRVSTSALRQWLNSDTNKGAWWTAPKTGYCPPSQLNSIKGFMAGLSQDFLDCVAKVKRTYYTNSVTDGSVIDVLYDKFFSATGTELYGSVNDNEGTYFPYYKEVTGLSAPSNSQNTGRIKYALNAKTSSLNCWAFSSNRGYSCYVWRRGAAGHLYFNGANDSYRAVPACVIG